MTSSFTQVRIEEKYLVERKLGTGRFGNIHLASDKRTGGKVAVKIFALDSKELKSSDILREYNWSRQLSANQSNCFIKTFEGVFCTPVVYYFVQEVAPLGSLREVVYASKIGLTAHNVKKILKHIINAVEYLHDEDLVHRNIQAKNVLIFDEQFAVVKLADFGLLTHEKDLVKHFDRIHEYHAPEICDTMQREMYAVQRSVDIWAIGILVFFALRARYPWQQAKFTCHAYWSFEEYVGRRIAVVPKQFSWHSPRMLKFFIKTLNPDPKKRYCIRDMNKYLTITWFKDSAKIGEVDDEETLAEQSANSHSGELETKRRKDAFGNKVARWFSETFAG